MMRITWKKVDLLSGTFTIYLGKTERSIRPSAIIFKEILNTQVLHIAKLFHDSFPGSRSEKLEV